MTLRANLSNAAAQVTSVRYTTTDVTATGGFDNSSGIDYETQTNQMISFSAGATFAVIIIPINQDSIHEGNETFTLTLSNALGVEFSNFASTLIATVTIVDDETPTLSVVNSTLSVSERAGHTAVELELSGPTSGNVMVTYSTLIDSGTDTAQQADFTAHSSQTVSIASAQIIGKIEVPITNDIENETDETFTIMLSGITGAVFSDGSSIVVKVTIIDDEELPTLTLDSTTLEVTEGRSPAFVRLTLSPEPTDNVTVTYSTFGLTASNDGTDYMVHTNTNHIITSGNSTDYISIPITNDRRFEPTETFSVKITSVSGAAFKENVQEITTTITILDDEPMPTLSIQNTSVTTAESGNAEIVMEVSNPSDSVISFMYSTMTGTASNADYSAQNSVRHVFGSETTDKILIPIKPDEINEIDEQFSVTFTNLSGAVFANGVSPTSYDHHQR